MRVVFLDFDGVLTRETDPGPPQRFTGLQPDLVELLNQILERTGALVVITTAWRFHYGAKALQVLLEQTGFRGKVVGTCMAFLANLVDHHQSWQYREHEIAAWARLYDVAERDYIVLDDFRMQTLVRRQILSESAVGLTPALVEQSVRLLGLER